jgi:hypothetical protein
MKNNANSYGRIWDSYSLTPWYKYQSPDWYQGWYDDSVSLGIKYDYVNSQNLKGIGIWALSYDGSNTELWNTISSKFTSPTYVNEEGGTIKDFILEQNFPNPFNPTTSIRYTIPKHSFVNLTIYSINGKEVGTFINKSMKTGSYSEKINLDGLPSGIYYYVLNADSKHLTRKMIYLK